MYYNCIHVHIIIRIIPPFQLKSKDYVELFFASFLLLEILVRMYIEGPSWRNRWWTWGGDVAEFCWQKRLNW